MNGHSCAIFENSKRAIWIHSWRGEPFSADLINKDEDGRTIKSVISSDIGLFVFSNYTIGILEKAEEYLLEKKRGMSAADLKEWIKNTCDAARNHSPQKALIDFFTKLKLQDSFDKLWQFGAFDSWTHNPTQHKLARLLRSVERMTF